MAFVEVYPVYTQLMAGVAVTPPLTAAHAFDLDAVARTVTDRTKLVLLASPNNPTGTALSTNDMAALVEGISPRTIVVIDEAYREFLDRSLGDPVRDLVPRFDNVIVTRTFSKAQGMAGIAPAMQSADPDVIASIDKTLFPFAVSALAQAGAIAAIDAEAEIGERIAMIFGERARVVAELTDDGWSCPTRRPTSCTCRSVVEPMRSISAWRSVVSSPDHSRTKAFG